MFHEPQGVRQSTLSLQITRVIPCSFNRPEFIHIHSTYCLLGVIAPTCVQESNMKAQLRWISIPLTEHKYYIFVLKSLDS